MNTQKIKEVRIHNKSLTQQAADFYTNLGLKAKISKHKLIIRSTRNASITQINPLHVRCNRNGAGDTEDLTDGLGNQVRIENCRPVGVKSIAVLTSGGDAPGMNAAIRAVVRTALRKGVRVYGIYRGYEGLINDNIEELSWDSVGCDAFEGGTLLQSARSQSFFTAEGRRRATWNLVKRNVEGLIVIGGDGSIKGATMLESEFCENMKGCLNGLSEGVNGVSGGVNGADGADRVDGLSEGVNGGAKDAESAKGVAKDGAKGVAHMPQPAAQPVHTAHTTQPAHTAHTIPSLTPYRLRVIAIPGSIDNDISKVDMTLGADTALHRVIEAVDNVRSTMISHRRVFVIEVMGRNCGWIALMSSFATSADFVFLPEAPVKDWKSELVRCIDKARRSGKKGIFVIVSEGAVDLGGNKIDPNEVRAEIDRKTGLETRVMTLGHVQRGGMPSAHDRISGTLMGIRAAEELLSPDYAEPMMVCISEGTYQTLPLRKIIRLNEEIAQLQKERRFMEMMVSRGKFFKRAYYLNDQLRKENETSPVVKRIGVLFLGRRAGGMNAALNAVVQYALSLGQRVFVIQDGFVGLLSGKVAEAKAYEYADSVGVGRSYIEAEAPTVDVSMAQVHAALKELQIEALIAIGGSKCLELISELNDLMRTESSHTSVILIPATINNNIPCTDMCIGTDTALNYITTASDFLKMSSLSMRKTVFVVEVFGGNSGYLAQMAGIASGAFDTFLPERKYKIVHLSETAQRLRTRFTTPCQSGIIVIRNEHTFSNASSDSFCRMLKTDSNDLYDTRYCVLSHLQYGGNPSPIDRINSTVLGIKAVDLVVGTDREGIVGESGCLVGVIGVSGQSIRFTGIKEAMEEYDRVHRRVKDPEWLKYSDVCRNIE